MKDNIETKPEPESKPKATSKILPIEQPLPEIAPVRKNSPLPVISLLILIILGAGIWWYLQHKNIPSETQIQDTETQNETGQAPLEQAPKLEPAISPEQETKPEPDSQVVQATSGSNAQDKTNVTTQAQSPLQQARALLLLDNQGQASLDLANKLKQELQTQPSSESLDALFLLFEDAAQKEVPVAMLALAQYYDPSSSDPKGSIEADANEAYVWYNKALSAGISEAQQHLDRLKVWAKEASNSGDKLASDLLNRWK